jgi:uncharacterized protein YecT (DUF1311 family)
MRMRVLTMALAAVALPAHAAGVFCDTDRIHPIDAQFEREMERSGGVTLHMREAQGRAHQAWDAELNRVYRELMSRQPAEEKALLRDAQRSWLSFRDAEEKLWWSETITGMGGGTMQPLLAADHGIAMLRERVCRLTRYLEGASTP